MTENGMSTSPNSRFLRICQQLGLGELPRGFFHLYFCVFLTILPEKQRMEQHGKTDRHFREPAKGVV